MAIWPAGQGWRQLSGPGDPGAGPAGLAAISGPVPPGGADHIASGLTSCTGIGTPPTTGSRPTWKGVLSQDFTPNPTYLEAWLGSEFADANCRWTKTNRIGILVSNESLTALQWSVSRLVSRHRWGRASVTTMSCADLCDVLFDLNLEVDS